MEQSHIMLGLILIALATGVLILIYPGLLDEVLQTSREPQPIPEQTPSGGVVETPEEGSETGGEQAEVKDSNLGLSPETHSFVRQLDGNNISTGLLEICNKGSDMVLDISISTSEGDAGGWVEGIQQIAGLQANSCLERTIKIIVPEDIPPGEYSGRIIVKSGSYEGSVELNIEVEGLVESFAFSWKNAEFANCFQDRCKRIEGFAIENRGTKPIIITGIRIGGWSERDSDNAKLAEIRFRSGTVWEGSAEDGSWIDINSFEIRPGFAYSDNSLHFDQYIKNDSEQFYISFGFADSNHSTEIWPEYSSIGDFGFSWANAEFSITGMDLAGWEIGNLSDSNEISIVRMKVSGWSKRDRDDVKLALIEINGSKRWKGPPSLDGEWIDIANIEIPALGSFSSNRLEFTQRIDNDLEQISIEFEFSDGNTFITEPWIYYTPADLWEIEGDRPQPLDFLTDINSTANTFGIGLGNDGWDWASDVYTVDGNCVRFNAEPDNNYSISDLSIGSRHSLIIEIGDYENQCSNNGFGSGAYGIELKVTEEMYNIISGGGTAKLLFDWNFWDHSLDEGDKAWIKARIGNKSGMNYLGYSRDSFEDESPEIFFADPPADSNGSVRIDVSSYITSPGTYYLELGAKLADWEDSEWLEAEFDNVDLAFK